MAEDFLQVLWPGSDRAPFTTPRLTLIAPRRCCPGSRDDMFDVRFLQPEMDSVRGPALRAAIPHRACAARARRRARHRPRRDDGRCGRDWRISTRAAARSAQMLLERAVEIASARCPRARDEVALVRSVIARRVARRGVGPRRRGIGNRESGVGRERIGDREAGTTVAKKLSMRCTSARSC